MAEYDGIGSRQSVDRARHPELGEGRVVHRNGAAVFIADDGRCELYDEVRLGGASVDGSYRVARVGAREIKLDTSGRQPGDHHQRIMDYAGRRGWLVWVAHPIDEPRPGFFRVRFEPDGGAAEKLFVAKMTMGLPGTVDKMFKRKKPGMFDTEKHWVTLELVKGWMFTYCLEENAEKVRWPEGKAPAQMGLL